MSSGDQQRTQTVRQICPALSLINLQSGRHFRANPGRISRRVCCTIADYKRVFTKWPTVSCLGQITSQSPYHPWPEIGTTQFLFDSTQSQKVFYATQLMAHNGFTRIDPNQLTSQNGFVKFDSNPLTIQKAFQNFDLNRLIAKKNYLEYRFESTHDSMILSIPSLLLTYGVNFLKPWHFLGIQLNCWLGMTFSGLSTRVLTW